MRIIAGRFKGLILKTPSGLHTRPTLSRIKETLFNILNQHLSGDFLELYAGSGSVGFEALSRGCDSVTMVEQDQRAIDVLKVNRAKLKHDQVQTRIIQSDAFAYVKKNIHHINFDYIFMDPPYQQHYVDIWNKDIQLSQLLKPHGQLIVQHDKKIKLPQRWSGADIVDERIYGVTALSFFKSNEVTGEK